MTESALFFRTHAVQRMFQRNVAVESVRQALASGEVIEDYSPEMPEPSQLVLGFQGKRPFHMVTSESATGASIILVTVYIPDPAKWTKDFRTRRT